VLELVNNCRGGGNPIPSKEKKTKVQRAFQKWSRQGKFLKIAVVLWASTPEKRRTII